MIKQTAFISMHKAEREYFKTNIDRVIISITGPVGVPSPLGGTSSKAKLQEQAFKAILRLEFHDANPSKFAHDSKLVLFDEKMAFKIMRFLKEHEESVSQAIVHCEAGVSRSAAVSKFIAQIYSLEFPEGYSVYNRHVFEVLYRAYGRCAYGEGLIKPYELPGIYYQKFVQQGETHGTG